MPNAQPLYDPAQAFTGRANGGAVTGRRIVKVAATKPDGDPTPIAHCGASDKPIGAAGSDAAQDDVTQVYPPGHVLLLTSGAAITAGQALEVIAAGKVSPLSSGTKVAVALTTVAGADLPVLAQLQF
jgi:hypothetical protein